MIRGRELPNTDPTGPQTLPAEYVMGTGSEPAESDERQRARVAMLQRVIVELHCCAAEHFETVHVKETFSGRTIWEGDVEIYKLAGHPRASRCYAWIKRIGRRTRLRF